MEYIYITTFKNANEAYAYQLNRILIDGVDFDDTKALFNIGFTIANPMDNHITNKERKWSLEYAEADGSGISQVIVV